MQSNDVDLVRRARAREPDAQRELGERLACLPQMLSCAARRKGLRLAESDRLDLAQDIATKAWNKIDDYRGDAPFEAWLWRFCVLELMNFLRRQQRGPRLFTDIGEDGVPEPVVAAAPIEDKAALSHWLRHLSTREAEVIELKLIDGLSFPEIADTLRLAVSSVKTTHYRAMEKLAALARTERESQRDAAERPTK